ncbi:MAG: 1-(5-phosphoribosyl)-5-[(5-phosphoribosylamino)methylideneamino]imidazole-4-carboxamide isomerase [Alphaproteobacteria bacterium]|jgi:phosphoribosylformimino-5-aminoimidazole carboxamide ribotide isomerase|nr:1-(5-phosphoribosyl)-5-[(5-phosphoribosylamino)methylideneamino]imidazole-4-carboxamide isomerase [Alphaproteobacteria bacterium]MDP7604477.1 1-(5-phosphoribosyl)-5-[(5-phosphoribosylamino)methylideneamino]imidazole-4-carboxamide isomerase [Alphaproteobacteria bacterium]HJP23014.1 1-(5-phosphoribosyl)-5-[(5-phosphoribosylamino)methylideneamino]imidazole-4-carboxamide isomerase [Alphaproteobacteria bacterium]
MILFPAIDLKDGQCVRLYKGDMQKATVFNADAGAQAREFSQAGFAWLHVVDLNGAFAGRPVNGDAVDAILAAATMPVQLGGGIRDLETVAMWLGRGISRVILGTAALRDPDLVRQACRAHPGQIAVGIDAVGGYVAVEGWAEVSSVTALDLALEFENAGVAAIIHTDVERDGVMAGPNVEATQALADSLSTPVIVSGGVSSLDDLAAVKRAEASGIAGVIVGRALYDGGLDRAAALALLAG